MDFCLADIQQRLKAPKSQLNKFGGYNYRSCEDILNAIKPLLAEHNAAIVIGDELILIGERYYVKATASLIREDKVLAVTTAYAREEEVKKGMDPSQITGAASSYARKYALNGLFAIDDTKDADATNKHDAEPDNKEEKKPTPKKKMTKEEFDAIVAFQKAKNNLGQPLYYEVLGLHGYEHCTDIPEEGRAAVLDDLRLAYKQQQAE